MAELDDLVRFLPNPDGSVSVVAIEGGEGYPMRCKRCGNVHDASKVEVIQRYADCSVWACPHCKTVGDDRPLSWGGTFERVQAVPWGGQS